MTDEKPLTEEELDRIEGSLTLRIVAPSEVASRADLIRLVAEVRRLRALVVEAAELFDVDFDLWGKHEAEVRKRLEREARR